MNKTKIPPDPEQMNDDRANWALQGLVAFTQETGQSFKDDGNNKIISDFLADLAHFCDRNGLLLEHLLQTASDHYFEETDRLGKQFEGGV